MRSYFYSKLVALAAVIGLSSLFLMFQTLTDDRPEMWVKPGMLFDKPTTEQLATDARIKGKIAVVEKKQFAAPSDIHIDGHFNKQGITGTEYFPEEMYAAIPEELETLIKIEYNKGKLINHVRTRGGIPDVVEIYSCLIDISVIDYKTSTVIARERLEEKKYRATVCRWIYPASKLTMLRTIADVIVTNTLFP